MVPTLFLSLSASSSSPTPQYESHASPLLMSPMTSLVPISTPIYMLLPMDYSTSCSDPTPIALPLDYLHLPITLCKGKCSCSLHPISHFDNYNNLLPTYCAFSLSYYRVNTKSHLEAVKLPHRKVTMDLEYEALVKQQTWVLVPQAIGPPVFCKNMYKNIKYFQKTMKFVIFFMPNFYNQNISK